MHKYSSNFKAYSNRSQQNKVILPVMCVWRFAAYYQKPIGVCWIQGFHSSGYEKFYLLGKMPTQSSASYLLFLRNTSLPSSGSMCMPIACFMQASCLAYSSPLKMALSPETQVDFHRTTQCYIPNDRPLLNYVCHANIKCRLIRTQESKTADKEWLSRFTVMWGVNTAPWWTHATFASYLA
jgi:hypothetical protein